MRTIPIALAALLLALPAAAQQEHRDHAQKPASDLPDGWHLRVDRDRDPEGVSFTRMGDGFHASTGPAAVFYDPTWTHGGRYDVSARFTQTRAPRHPEAYGIVIGGSSLDGPDQAYSYFLVRGTGEFFIATRNGAERTVVADWTPDEAIHKQDSSGRQTNVLGAEVRGGEVIFHVNGTEVARAPEGTVFGDGVFGFRINHNLDVHIDQVQR